MVVILHSEGAVITVGALVTEDVEPWAAPQRSLLKKRVLIPSASEKM